MTVWKRALGPALCLAFWAHGADTKIDTKVDPNLYLDEVKYLASPALKGRATGSPELEKAAAFLARQYREFGVRPARWQELSAKLSR